MDALFYKNPDHGRAWSMLCEGPLELHFIGASVTSQREGWADRFACFARAQSGHDHTLVKSAMGGVGLLFGVANYGSPAPNGLRRLLFIEFSTGDLNLGLTPLDRLASWLDHLVQRALADGAHVVIVHNWRSDFAVDDKPGIRSTYDTVALKYALPVIENHRFADALLNIGEIARETLFRDVCHTQPEGAARYAQHVLLCLQEMSLKCGQPPRELPLVTHRAPLGPISFFDLPTGTLSPDCGREATYTYPTTLQSFRVLEVPCSHTMAMIVSGSLLGISFLSGPRTGWVDLSIDFKQVRRFRCFDRNSFYERYILLPAVFELSNSELHLSCAPIDVQFSLAAKPHPDFALPRLMKIVQLAGIDLAIRSCSVRLST
ncbi:MAG: hypothetical protein WCT47_20725 [Betaproteobacteria bacterium]